MASGTSNPLNVSGEELQSRNNPQFSPVEGVDTDVNGKPAKVTPPVGNADYVSAAMDNRNSFPEFVFEKISVPQYGTQPDAIARYTGVPVNHPDYINDYHFIGLMRMVDGLVKPSYKGKVNNKYDTPAPKQNSDSSSGKNLGHFKPPQENCPLYNNLTSCPLYNNGECPYYNSGSENVVCPFLLG